MARPPITFLPGDQSWINNKNQHMVDCNRDDGPALVYMMEGVMNTEWRKRGRSLREVIFFMGSASIIRPGLE